MGGSHCCWPGSIPEFRYRVMAWSRACAPHCHCHCRRRRAPGRPDPATAASAPRPRPQASRRRAAGSPPDRAAAPGQQPASRPAPPPAGAGSSAPGYRDRRRRRPSRSVPGHRSCRRGRTPNSTRVSRVRSRRSISAKMRPHLPVHKGDRRQVAVPNRGNVLLPRLPAPALPGVERRALASHAARHRTMGSGERPHRLHPRAIHQLGGLRRIVEVGPVRVRTGSR